jgi:hypothetical protein
MAAFRYPSKRKSEVRFTAKDFSIINQTIKRDLDRLINYVDSTFDAPTPTYRKRIQERRTLLNKVKVLRRVKR